MFEGFSCQELQIVCNAIDDKIKVLQMLQSGQPTYLSLAIEKQILDLQQAKKHLQRFFVEFL